MSLNITQSNNDLTLQVHQSNVKATLSVTQSINKLHITAVQNNEVVELQPIITVNALAFVETDPVFQASEASLFVAGDKSNLDNQSGINTGDETTTTIQTKRPLKTVTNKSLEGIGNIGIDYNDLDNLPTIPTIITNHSGLNLNDGTNPHGTTKSDVGLGNIDNTSDVDKPISTATQTALNSKLNKDTTAGLERAYIINADGSQGTKATSDFKDVLEFANFASFPVTGESGKIYVALDKNFTYRWSGSAYVQIGGTAKKTENLFFQDAMGSTVRTITADQKNMHQSRYLANASPFGQLGLTLGIGIPETSGVINLAYLSDVITPQITGNYTGKVKKIVFTYARNVNESSANTNLMIRVMADTKYNTDMQLIAEHNLVSTTAIAFAENKVELPILTHLPLSAFSNIGWCIRSNNATAQQFGRIKINVIVEEV